MRAFLIVAVVVLAWSVMATPARSGLPPVGHDPAAASSPDAPPPSPSRADGIVPIVFAALIPGLRRRQEHRRVNRAVRLGIDLPYATHGAPGGERPERTSSIFGMTRPPL